MVILKECRHHGQTEFRRQTSKGKESYYCIPCHVDRQRKRRQARKQKAVEYKGGKCVKCGYSKSVAAMDFHHLDPTVKEFALASRKDLSWDQWKIELDKCILLCANCHREIHEND